MNKKYLVYLIPLLIVLLSNVLFATDKTKKAPVTIPPINLNGIGQQASSKFVLAKGLSVFKLTHKGDSNFAVMLLNNDGDLIELLVNRIGDFKGSKAVHIESQGKHILDITANGKWTVEITQPRAKTAPTSSHFSGDDQQVTKLFHLEKGLVIFKMKHSGDANFAPFLMDKDGNLIALLANEIGRFDGSKAVKIPHDSIFLLDVTANGKWEISIE